jgi:hypothetical protein
MSYEKISMDDNGKIWLQCGPGGCPYPPPGGPEGSPEFEEWLEYVRKFEKKAKDDFLAKRLGAVKNKGINAEVRRLYETKTGMNGTPGTGPANNIRAFLGIKVPKGAKGGSKSRKTRRLRQKSKKSRSKK